MREVHLRNVDLNLLHSLYALLEERHVSHAAKRSFLSQPAMSRALDRLRETFGDPLLVRTGRVYERTPRGERVLRELESIMGRLGAMVQGEEFSPARSHERFHKFQRRSAGAKCRRPSRRKSGDECGRRREGWRHACA